MVFITAVMATMVAHYSGHQALSCCPGCVTHAAELRHAAHDGNGGSHALLLTQEVH
jgi:hypothetical protein